MHPERAEVHHEPDEASGRGGGGDFGLEVRRYGHRPVLPHHLHSFHRHHNNSRLVLSPTHICKQQPWPLPQPRHSPN